MRLRESRVITSLCTSKLLLSALSRQRRILCLSYAIRISAHKQNIFFQGVKILNENVLTLQVSKKKKKFLNFSNVPMFVNFHKLLEHMFKCKKQNKPTKTKQPTKRKTYEQVICVEINIWLQTPKLSNKRTKHRKISG